MNLHVACLAGALVSPATPGAFARTGYELTALASFGKDGANTQPQAINEAGRVVGYGQTALERCHLGLCSYQHAVFWSDGIPLDRHPFESLGVSGLNDINNAGQMVGGWADIGRPGGRGAFVRQDGVVIILPSLGGWTWATGVNDVGEIVGWSAVAVEENRRAVVWHNGELIELGIYPDGMVSYAQDINDVGQIVGTAALVGTSGDRRATLWQGGAMINLGTLPGGMESFGVAINEAGQIVGWAEQAGSVYADRAVMWQQDHRTDEWTIVALSHDESRAYDINDLGHVVGRSASVEDPQGHATLWINGEIVDLNDVLVGNTGWTLWRAWTINNAGQIAGQGRDAHGNANAFLLTPIATDPTDADEDVDSGERLALFRDWGILGVPQVTSVFAEAE